MQNYMPQLSQSRIAPLSSLWWDKLIEEWNRSSFKNKLAGFGPICFQVLDSDFAPVWIEWDTVGRAEHIDVQTKDSPCLSASEANWMAFINGEFTATTGVLQGRITYRGELSQILPYSLAFNHLAKAAALIT